MISFVIPTLNEEKTLAGTLENLAGYSGPHEIIISDGQSRDRTVEIARAHGAKIVIYEGTTRQTIAMGRNAGVAAASGDFLVSMDADVTIPGINNFFATALNCFEKNQKLVGLTVCYRVLPELATFWDKVIFKIVGYNFFLLNNILHIGGSGGEFQLMRAADFKRVGGFDEKLTASEDMDLFSRLNKIGRTRFEPSLFIYHTGRRPHKVGWPRLLYQWIANALSLWFFHRSASAEWTEVR